MPGLRNFMFIDATLQTLLLTNFI